MQLVAHNKFLTSWRAQRKILLDQVSTLDQKVEYWERCVQDEGKEVVVLVRQKRRQEMEQERNSHSLGVNTAAVMPDRATNAREDRPKGPQTVRSTSQKGQL